MVTLQGLNIYKNFQITYEFRKTLYGALDITDEHDLGEKEASKHGYAAMGIMQNMRGAPGGGKGGGKPKPGGGGGETKKDKPPAKGKGDDDKKEGGDK